MFTKIKEFLFGKPSQLEVDIKTEAPYKVETKPEPSVAAAPVAKPKPAPAKPAPAKPAPVAKPKTPARPRAKKAPAK